jgi:hypothetical protein
MQTATNELLEWLKKQPKKPMSRDLLVSKFLIAAESEKNNIINAFNEGYRCGFNDAESWVSGEDIAEFDDAINYFNETFLKNK